MQNRRPGSQTRQPMTVKRNIRLILAFEGTAYHGWQIQRNLPTIQGILTELLAKITRERVALIGCGRTDAGTHAREYVANFLMGSSIPPPRLVRALNGMLPRDIRILSARRVAGEFHARRSARFKVYRYQIYLGPILAPHRVREYLHYPYPIDIHKMQRAARLFIGEHDFTSFAKANSSSNSVRRIFRCELKKLGHCLFLTVQGNGFLHHMVRNMAGTLLEVGREIMGLDEFRDLFAKRDRTHAGFTAPAHGLVLLKIRY